VQFIGRKERHNKAITALHKPQTCLWMIVQPASNPNHRLKQKNSLLHHLLVVVVYRAFSSTTTIEKTATEVLAQFWL
jgi:hypothetical protein